MILSFFVFFSLAKGFERLGFKGCFEDFLMVGQKQKSKLVICLGFLDKWAVPNVSTRSKYCFAVF